MSVKVIRATGCELFEDVCKEYIKEGYELINSKIGLYDKATRDYEFIGVFQKVENADMLESKVEKQEVKESEIAKILDKYSPMLGLSGEDYYDVVEKIRELMIKEVQKVREDFGYVGEFYIKVIKAIREA
jgi:hypothetical protein